MDLKVVCVIVCLCALAIIPTEGIPKCCISTRPNIPNKLLRNIRHWYVQEANGICDIRALVGYIPGREKPICIHEKYISHMWKLRKTKYKAY
ncbi:C-C motif chemokine 27a [Mugil cephalus]|uniref:C-C motif chemokine 27a n=1 Tax=Mugil cephalus TaxID=48193 RepID=UPI001FB82614|nr:C-C motif chemokine 27a [Mugil cephalus]